MQTSITLFTIPQDFEEEYDLIQRNAIKSWTLFNPEPDIFLLGNAPGIASIANELGLYYIPNIDQNSSISDIAKWLDRLVNNTILVYVNPCVILTEGLTQTIQEIYNTQDHFFLTGQYRTIQTKEAIDFNDNQWQHQLRVMADKRGMPQRQLQDIYLVFTKQLLKQLFVLDHNVEYTWEQQLFYAAVRKYYPIIDGSPIITAFLQIPKHYKWKVLDGLVIKPSAERNKPTYEKYEQILTQLRLQNQSRLQKIDVVYLWVDSNDLNWQALKDKFTKDRIWPADSVSSNRFADHDELLYSLRSLEQYVPWVNHIYIVTMLGQCPPWLKRSHPKITLVDHTEIIPLEYLPTFNSEVIQCHVHRIPNLSDNFILMDDDTFFGNNVSIENFILDNGKIKVFLDERTVYQGIPQPHDSIYKIRIKYSNARLDDKFGNTRRPNASHYMKIFNKNVLELAEKIFIEDWKNTCSHKFRLETTISVSHIASYTSLYLNQGIIESNVDGIYVGYDENNIKYLHRMLSKVKQRQPKFFCLNEVSPIFDDNITKTLSNFLKTLFPSKSLFEY